MLAEGADGPDGPPAHEWLLVVLKELMDNGLDACEEARVVPEIVVRVDDIGITVTDNGPGIPESTIRDVLDFTVRVSSREAYAAPDRGAQGNALKTPVAMPFALDGNRGLVEVAAHGQRHRIEFAVDPIRQEPRIGHEAESDLDVKSGMIVKVHWPNSASSILDDAKGHFLQIADDYTWLNPHLTLLVDWFGEQFVVGATDPEWPKWRPSDPTSPHWYQPQQLERLIAGYVAHDQDLGRDRKVREFVAEFRGLSGSAKQKAVLEATGLARANLSGLCNGAGVDREHVEALLAAMKANSRPVKPRQLGVIGHNHLRLRFMAVDCEMKSFDYRKVEGETDGVPWIVEAAFGWCPEAEGRRLVTGVNWSPGIINPFRQLGRFGESLDAVLAQQRATQDEPVILVLHMACPRVEYTDRGKSAIVIGN